MNREELPREDAASALDCRKIYVDEVAIRLHLVVTIRKVQAAGRLVNSCLQTRMY